MIIHYYDTYILILHYIALLKIMLHYIALPTQICTSLRIILVIASELVAIQTMDSTKHSELDPHFSGYVTRPYRPYIDCCCIVSSSSSSFLNVEDNLGSQWSMCDTLHFMDSKRADTIKVLSC